MLLCNDVWNNILEYASISPRYAAVNSTFKNISYRIYNEYIAQIRLKYNALDINIPTLNQLALEGNWNDILIICHIFHTDYIIKNSSRIYILFNKMLLLEKINPKHLFLMWLNKNQYRFKETRRMLYQNLNEGLEFVHPDMAFYIRKMRHIPKEFCRFLWKRIMCHKERPEYFLCSQFSTLDDIAAYNCKPHHNFALAIACSNLTQSFVSANCNIIKKALATSDIVTPEIIKLSNQLE